MDAIAHNDQIAVTGDAYINSLPSSLRLAAWAALVRVFTLGQAARFAYNANIDMAAEELRTLVMQRRYFGKLGPITLARYMGPAARKTTHVYYLTTKGADALAAVAPELSRRHARPGRPEGATLNRVSHELLVAEAWLWQREQGREVLEFLPETALKRELMLGRNTGLTTGALPADEATGDFKMHVREIVQNVAWWFEGEVAVRYKLKEIAGKPDHMEWFCCDDSQALLIEFIKGIRPYMLNDVRAPYTSEPDPATAEARKSKRGRIQEALALMGGTITAPSLRALVGGHRTRAAAKLRTLEKEGVLRCRRVSIRPGQERGRPTLLYIEQGQRLLTAHETVQRACAAQMVVEGVEDGYQPLAYDPVHGVLTFRSPEATTSLLLCVIDTAAVTTAELRGRLQLAIELAPSNVPTRVMAVIANNERLGQIIHEIPQDQIYDLRTRVKRATPSSTVTSSPPVSHPIHSLPQAGHPSTTQAAAR